MKSSFGNSKSQPKLSKKSLQPTETKTLHGKSGTTLPGLSKTQDALGTRY